MPPRHRRVSARVRLQAQECCDGGSLRRLIERAATSTGRRLYLYADALRWCTQTAEALQYLHEANPQVVHRDLKAENIMLASAGRASDAKLMDFGLAKLRCALLPLATAPRICAFAARMALPAVAALHLYLLSLKRLNTAVL
jgi:serine/threonine protein kinase